MLHFLLIYTIELLTFANFFQFFVFLHSEDEVGLNFLKVFPPWFRYFPIFISLNNEYFHRSPFCCFFLRILLLVIGRTQSERLLLLLTAESWRNHNNLYFQIQGIYEVKIFLNLHFFFNKVSLKFISLKNLLWRSIFLKMMSSCNSTC